MDKNVQDLIEITEANSDSICIGSNNVDFIKDELKISFISVERDKKYASLTKAVTLITLHGPKGKTKHISVIGYHRIGDEISKCLKSLDFNVEFITDRYLGRIKQLDHKQNIEDQIVNDPKSDVYSLFLLCGEIFYVSPEELFREDKENKIHAYMIGKDGASLCCITQSFKKYDRIVDELFSNLNTDNQVHCIVIYDESITMVKLITAYSRNNFQEIILESYLGWFPKETLKDKDALNIVLDNNQMITEELSINTIDRFKNSETIKTLNNDYTGYNKTLTTWDLL